MTHSHADLDRSKLHFLKAAHDEGISSSDDINTTVTSVIEKVAGEGDAALSEYALRFDNIEMTEFQVSEAEINAAIEGMESITRADSEFAIEQVRAFAEAQRKSMTEVEVEHLPGVKLGHRIIPISRIGCYVPGGRYPILSAPVMSIVPAKVAKCEHIVACLPPKAHSSMIAVCHLSGADAIYRIGGAQAIAAMAYGTETVPAVDKIVGPGNAFVNEAKRQVFGRVGIDALAGPSEILTIADESGDPLIIAADLLAQAEHDVHTRVGLATTSEDLAIKTAEEIQRQLRTLSTRAVAEAAWEARGEIVVCDDQNTLIDFANLMATEHLQVHATNADEWVGQLKNYGSLFIGENASVVYSDKCCGTNHTLPTEAAARYTGGLWVGTYLKTCTHQQLSSDGIAAVAPHAVRQALTEGMEGHARAAALRLYPDKQEAITSGTFPKS